METPAPRQDQAVSATAYYAALRRNRAHPVRGSTAVPPGRNSRPAGTSRMFSIRVMKGRERPPHGDRMISNVAKDGHLGVTLLYRSPSFRRALLSLYARTNLSWTHSRTIITLPTLDSRNCHTLGVPRQSRGLPGGLDRSRGKPAIQYDAWRLHRAWHTLHNLGEI